MDKINGMIDFGKKPAAPSKAEVKSPPAKTYYPSIHVTDIEGLESMPHGEFSFTGKGKMVSCTKSMRNGKTSYSCEIEIHGLKPNGASKGGLADELDKIEAKKSKK